MKFVPVTVNSKAASPAFFVVGAMAVRVGAGLLTVRLIALDVPPPGVGLNTVIAGVPAEARSAAVICAVNCVGLTTAVTRSLPLRRTIELLLKPVPLTVKAKAGSPTVLTAGLIVVIVGAGLLIVKVIAVVVPPPGAGLKTVMDRVPAVATSATVSCAVN